MFAPAGNGATDNSSRDPVRSRPRYRRVRLRELGLPTGRRTAGIHEPAYTRRTGRDPADQLQGERRKLSARYEALVTSSWRLTQQR